MNAFRTIFVKECVENLRAKRTLASALIFGPLLGPFLLAIMINVMTGRAEDRAEETLEVPVVGAEHAPNLVTFMKQQGVVIEPAPDDPEAAVKSETEEVVVSIPADYGERFRRSEPAPVTLIIDQSQRESSTKVARVRQVIQSYGSQIGSLRLQARGISPTVVRAVSVSERDLSTPTSRGARIMSMVPYFLMIGLFVGSMYLAIDTTAGERERQTLESLLINPPPRWQVAAGKLAATTAFALASLIITIIAFSVALGFIDLEGQGVSLSMSTATAIKLFWIVLPVAFLAASLQTIVAAFARSFREAQTYVSMLIFVPMVPSLALMLLPLKPELWMMATPILGQNLLIERLLRGMAIDPLNLIVACVATTLAAVALSVIAARLYYREQFAFAST